MASGTTAETAAMVDEAADGLEPEQLALLPVAAPALQAEARGRGRPAGSRNKARQAWRDLVLRSTGSPLLRLASLAAMPVGDLYLELRREQARVVELLKAENPGAAARLQTALEAHQAEAPSLENLAALLRLQVLASKELLPYLHEKLTPGDDGGGGVVHLHVHRDGQSVAATVDQDAVKIEDIQGVDIFAEAKSDAPQSDT